MNVPPPPAANKNQPRRILVIDDDSSVGAAIQIIMRRRHYETVLTSRACAGIQALEQAAFDVVMIDIFMPGLSGLDTIEHIRRFRPIPIIAMSGFFLRTSTDSADYLAMAAQRGATLCMRKPFKADQLVEAIQWTGNLRDQVEGPMY